MPNLNITQAGWEADDHAACFWRHMSSGNKTTSRNILDLMFVQ